MRLVGLVVAATGRATFRGARGAKHGKVPQRPPCRNSNAKREWLGGGTASGARQLEVALDGPFINDLLQVVAEFYEDAIHRVAAAC